MYDPYDRENCVLRGETGNCGCVGGFCTAVNDEICRGLKNAYFCGIADGVKAVNEVIANQRKDGEADG